MSEIFSVDCPHCQKKVPWTAESPFRPFCSKRCQLIDLGEWAAEDKAIAGEPSLDLEMPEYRSEQ